MTGIQIGDDYDMVVKDGSLLVGDTTAQNQAVIIASHKGEFKEQPSVGVGISDMLLDHDSLAWRQEIREQLEIDGQTVNKITVTKTGITVDANY